jgi:hypothetical protein
MDSHTPVAPDTLLGKQLLPVAVQRVVPVRKRNGNVMPNIGLKEASMLVERGPWALSLGIRERVHAEKLHVVCCSHELSPAKLHQAAPGVDGLQIHPEGQGKDRGGAGWENRSGEAGMVLVGSIGVENTFADLTQRRVRHVRDVRGVDQIQVGQIRVGGQRVEMSALQNG